MINKKYMLFAFLFCLVIYGASGQSRIPQVIRDYIQNAPEDVMFGVGIANLVNHSNSAALADLRARLDIAREISKKAADKYNINIYNMYDKIEDVLILEDIFLELVFEMLNDTRIEIQLNHDGDFWSIAELRTRDAELKYFSIFVNLLRAYELI
jgi:hypothetical protein